MTTTDVSHDVGPLPRQIAKMLGCDPADLRPRIVEHAAGELIRGIDRMPGHSARTLLRRLVEDLTSHPQELGAPVAVLRIIERHIPLHVPTQAQSCVTQPKESA